MSHLRQSADSNVLVRFWSLDHHAAEAIPWPTSPWGTLVFALEGTLHVETQQHLHLLTPNRALWVPPGVPHPARTLGRAKVRTLYFSPQIDLRADSQVVEVRPLFRELIAEACRIGPLHIHVQVESSLARLIQYETHHAYPAGTSIPMPKSAALHGWALAFLKHPTSPARIGLSKRTIERRMLAETQLSLGQWCQQARALVGIQALSNGLSVAEAAMEAGYATASGFIASFQRQFGTTPGKMIGFGRSRSSS